MCVYIYISSQKKNIYIKFGIKKIIVVSAVVVIAMTVVIVVAETVAITVTIVGSCDYCLL